MDARRIAPSYGDQSIDRSAHRTVDRFAPLAMTSGDFSKQAAKNEGRDGCSINAKPERPIAARGMTVVTREVEDFEPMWAKSFKPWDKEKVIRKLSPQFHLKSRL